MVFELLLIVIGLALFELITSVDNAVINAEVLGGVSHKMRRWFLSWGILIAVVLVRGVVPLLIVMAANPGVGVWEALTFTFEEGDQSAFEQSASVLLVAGGVFLICVFLHWLFLEDKKYGLHHERFFHRHSVWFYAAVSIFLAALVWFSIEREPLMAFGAVTGSTAFFIVHGFRLNAEKVEHDMIHGGAKMSDWAKIFYLEAIDASFSLDGVVGAFAFTLSVPLILLGNGIGALAVRQLTVANIDRIKKYVYLKHGAMYSILFLGALMIAESFGHHPPTWLAPVLTFVLLAYFLWRSVKEPRASAQAELPPLA
jgi:hypothetical protein